MSLRETLIDGVGIRVLEPVNTQDKRGQTIEWHKGWQCMQITKCFYGKGSIAGNHYHRGNDPSKAPEHFSFNYGELDLVVCDGVHFKERHFIVPWNEPHTPRYEVTIAPGILHAMLFHTAGSFDEWRHTAYDREKSDTYGPETFEQYLYEHNRPIAYNALGDFTALCVQFPALVGNERGVKT